MKLAKGMFTSSPALDHRDSIDEMHEYVWDVPRKHGEFDVLGGLAPLLGEVPASLSFVQLSCSGSPMDIRVRAAES